MKTIKKIPFLIALCVVLTSCDNNFLSPEPRSFFTPENTFVDPQGYESLLVTMRKSFAREATGNRHYLSSEFVSSDLAVAVFQMDFFKNTPSNSQFFPYLRMFDDIYSFLKNSNVIVSRIDDIEWPDTEVRDAILAEAYWHRAYWYYRLVHSYGDVPWIGEELHGAKLDFETYSRWAILDKIQEDLEWAAERLHDSANPGVPTKAAANHLLAKVYLANMEYDNAIAAATAVIDGPHALMTERFGSYADDPNRDLMWDLHRAENINNSQNTEVIYSMVDRPEAPSAARSPGLYTMRLYTPSWWKIQDSSGGIGTVENSEMGDTLGAGNGDVRTNVFWHRLIWNDENYTWEDTPDRRRSSDNWIEMEEIKFNDPSSPNLGESVNKDYYGQLIDTTDTWFPWPYYKVYQTQHDSGRPMGGNGDWYIFRLAETYLIRAEAHYWNDNPGLAADDINTVRDRADAPLIAAGDVDLDYIFDERARELYMEEPRHSEMVRASYLMAAEQRDGYSLDNFSDNNWYYDRVMAKNLHYHEPRLRHYGNTATLEPHNVLWAIPQSVITANTQGRVNQNEGYTGAEDNVSPIETIE